MSSSLFFFLLPFCGHNWEKFAIFGKVLPDVAGFHAFVARLCAAFVAPFAPLLSRPFRAGFA